MKTTLAIALLLVTPSLSAELRVTTSEERIEPESVRGRALRKAIRATAFADGTEWVTHPVWAKVERSPIGVTRFAPDGSSRLFLASDLLPRSTMPRGLVGQVYGVAELPGGRIAAAVGWHDGESHNAIAVLDATRDGAYTPVKVIELPGVSSIVDGPDGTILAITDDASARGGGALLTWLDAKGKVLGTFFPSDSASPRAAVQNSLQSSIQRVAGNRYALYDHARRTIHVFELQADEKVKTLHRIFIDGDATLSALPVLATYVTPKGNAVVVRTGVAGGGAPASVVTAFNADGATLGTWRSRYPWNAVVRRGARLQGIAMHDSVVVESVEVPGV